MIQDRSVDCSLDGDINAAQPDNAPLENLLDSNFPDMAVKSASTIKKKTTETSWMAKQEKRVKRG